MKAKSISEVQVAHFFGLRQLPIIDKMYVKRSAIIRGEDTTTASVTTTAEKRRVWYEVKRAVELGYLARPSTCSRCGRPGKVDAHHADYREPWSISWLCRSCHKRTR